MTVLLNIPVCPKGTLIADAASICKKCILPKPPRTHHCSVCDKCILAMDHHCPWLNNCVGYYNARYFYLYMVYMVTGVTFIIIAGVDIGYQVLWLNDTGGYFFRRKIICFELFLNYALELLVTFLVKIGFIPSAFCMFVVINLLKI